MLNDGRCHCRGCDQARVQGAEDVAKRIRELHKPTDAPFPICHECNRALVINNAGAFILYPCDTIKALDGANGSLEDV